MRNDFHAQLDGLLERLLSMADRVDGMLGDSLGTLHSPTAGQPTVERLRELDDIVNEDYADTQTRVLRLIALQAPVASDLRLLAGMLHVNIHLERMSEYTVSVARRVVAAGHPLDESVAHQLAEMGDRARAVGREGVRAFATRDLDLAAGLADMDDEVDRLNASIFRRLVAVASDDEASLSWATQMIPVTRVLERYGDHGVDLGEQATFVVTGDTSGRDPGTKP